MLVLTRRVGDVVAIGDNIKVIVVSVNGKQVRLGIEADRSTIIHREEIYQKIKKETLGDTANTINEMSSRGLTAGTTSTFIQQDSATTLPEKKVVIIRKKPLTEMNDAN